LRRSWLCGSQGYKRSSTSPLLHGSPLPNARLPLARPRNRYAASGTRFKMCFASSSVAPGASKSPKGSRRLQPSSPRNRVAARRASLSVDAFNLCRFASPCRKAINASSTSFSHESKRSRRWAATAAGAGKSRLHEE